MSYALKTLGDDYTSHDINSSGSSFYALQRMKLRQRQRHTSNSFLTPIYVKRKRMMPPRVVFQNHMMMRLCKEFAKIQLDLQLKTK